MVNGFRLIILLTLTISILTAAGMLCLSNSRPEFPLPQNVGKTYSALHFNKLPSEAKVRMTRSNAVWLLVVALKQIIESVNVTQDRLVSVPIKLCLFVKEDILVALKWLNLLLRHHI